MLMSPWMALGRSCFAGNLNGSGDFGCAVICGDRCVTLVSSVCRLVIYNNMFVPQYNISLSKPVDDTKRAQVVWNLFVATFENAVLVRANALAEFEGQKYANKTYTNTIDGEVGGFGSRFPYSDEQIKASEKRCKDAEANLEDARAMLTFIRDRFLANINFNK